MNTTRPTYEDLLELTRRQERLLEELQNEVALLKADLAKRLTSEASDAPLKASESLDDAPDLVFANGASPSEARLEDERPTSPEDGVRSKSDQAAGQSKGEETAESLIAVDDRLDISTQTEASKLVSESSPDSETAASSERGRPTRPQLRPEDVGEFLIEDSERPPLPDSYRLWNHAIAEQLLLSHHVGQDVYLAITPRTLAGAFSSLDEVGRPIEDFEQDFVTAVRSAYYTRVVGSRARLDTLRCVGQDGIPECIAFLALSVLAAYRMHSDEEASGSAYYKRLAALLNCSMAGGCPTGFDPSLFELLWLFVKSWLKQKAGARLVLPGVEAGIRRFVALPLAHVPLRCLDIEKLPNFFDWACYPPRGRVPVERLRGDLLRWDRARSMLTRTGSSALTDERLAAVLAQTASELESWDGTLIDSLRSRSAIVEVLLEVVRRQPELYYLPRRPAGFPGRFDDGTHVFESLEEGWYDPVPIRPEDGSELKTGFNWSVQDGRMQTILRRPAAAVVPLTRSLNASGFVSSRSLLRGVACAVLCNEDATPQAGEYLSFISSAPCRPLSHPRIPDGWFLFIDVRPARAGETPSGLEILGVDADIEIMPAGGIRLGRRWAWLQGAPPRILVSGLEPGASVLVDGKPKPVGEDGTLQMNGAFQQTGLHLIEASRVRRTVEIVAPQLAAPTSVTQLQSVVNRQTRITSTALPPGRWTVLGAVPGDAATSFNEDSGCSLMQCSFEPVWAVQAGAGPGAEVLCLSRGTPPVPSPLSAKTRTERMRSLHWAEVIYHAKIRRPSMRSLFFRQDDVELTRVWQNYAAVARQIKRQLKPPSRRSR